MLAIPRKARAEVRKGLKNGFRITTGNGETDRAAHYACYSESVRNLGTPVFPRSLFGAVLDAFGDDADILTVWSDRPSPTLSLYHRGDVMPIGVGRMGRTNPAREDEVMYYELMRHARRKGCVAFDFGRSTSRSRRTGASNQAADLFELVRRSAGAQCRPDGLQRKIELWKKLPLGVATWSARP